MKIVFLDQLTLGEDVDLTELNKVGDFETFPYTRDDEVIKRCIDADIVITNKVYFTKEVIDQLPKLKLISVTAVGLDNIDVDYAKSKKIEVKNVVGYSTKSVAQHTFASVFYFCNHQHEYDKIVKKGEWEASPVFNKFVYPIESLENKKWGIIGLGNIGKEVARKAECFGAEVSYYSTTGKNNHEHYQRKDLDLLLKESDIISIHCPLNDNTKNLITNEKIMLLKDNAIIVNVARGNIIDEDALVQYFLKTNIRLSFDVLAHEPLSIDSPFKKIFGSKRLLLTPHIAWGSYLAKDELVKRTILNVSSFASR